MQTGLSRRDFLLRVTHRVGWIGAGVLGGAALLPIACSLDEGSYSSLEAPDRNGLRLAKGLRSRIVATTREAVEGTNHVWHGAPDGGAVFATDDRGWIYVSNSEVDRGEGGVGAIRFASDGSIRDAYSILLGTDRNCGGGATPWRTWLSCEETGSGEVYECDPYVPGSQGVVRPALGAFRHEAAAVDPIHQRIYLTEDETDGLLYRFTPSHYPNLSKGVLEAAEILDPNGMGKIEPGQRRGLAWHVVEDPTGSAVATRFQPPNATSFNGGEGCDYEAGQVYFSTKGDDRVWEIDTRSDQIGILYDRETSPRPLLSDVDNVLAAQNGVVYVAEDPGQLQIIALGPSGRVQPIVRVVGQLGSELTGPAMTPDGKRLYFSSQRNPGTTYEVSGPF